MASYKQIEDLIEESRLALDNAQNKPGITAVLQQFGYGPDKLAEGQALLQALEDVNANQVALKARQGEAAAAARQAVSAVRKPYNKQVKLARILLEATPELYKRLDLAGTRAQALNSFLAQTQQFYREALADEEILATLAGGGITRAQLEENQARIPAITQANSEQAALKGQAQQATKNRNAAAAALRKWMGNFFKIAEVGFADQPQLLEQLGKVVKS